MERGASVYIMMNFSNTSIYIGVTSKLLSGIERHQNGVGSKFTSKYNCKKLIYFEFFSSMEEATAREKQLNGWHREWKLNLVKEDNPEFEDLYPGLVRLFER